MEESKQIRKAQQGDQDAYAKLFEKYQSLIQGIAFKILENEADAEEIASDVFMKGIKAYVPDKVARFDNWLLGKITTNTCRDRIRWNKAKKRKGRDECDDEKLTAKPTALPDHNEDEDEAPRYWKIEGGPPIGERDLHLQILVAEEERRKTAGAVKQARENFLFAAKEKIKKWPNEAHRQYGLRIASDPRIVKMLDEFSAASGGRVGDNQFLHAVRVCAECAEPYKEQFTPEDADAAIKVLEYYGRQFHGAPAGSGLEGMPESIGTMLRLLRPIASRKGTKTILHQYDCILRLDTLRGMCKSRRRPNKAIILLLEITYGERWTAKKLATYRERARKGVTM